MGQILQQLVLYVLIGNPSILNKDLWKENTLNIPRWGKYYNNPFNIHARLPNLYRVPIPAIINILLLLLLLLFLLISLKGADPSNAITLEPTLERAAILGR